MQNAITIKNLVKEYNDNTLALNNINLTVQRGEIFGLLGPNGAGKTTMINIICGLTKKTSGEVLVLGKDVITDYQFTRGKIGLVPQELSGEHHLGVAQAVEYTAGYFGQKVSGQEIDTLLGSLGLLKKRKANNRRLSGGMKRRLMIAKALIHKPEILFLDEPTAGVDIELRLGLWDFIKSLKDSGTTVILTTHYIEEAERLCDRISIINNGKILLTESKDQLVKQFDSTLEEIYVQTIKNGNHEPSA